MHFDLPTLLAADSFVTAVVGVLLLAAAWRGHDAPAAAWWSWACIFVAAATFILALRRGLPDLASRATVATLINIAAAMFWGAAWRCHHDRVPVTLVLAGSVLWVAALVVPGFRDSPHVQMALFGLCGSVYSYAAAFEMWRGRAERLRARWPLLGLFVLDGSVNAVGAIEAFLGELSADTLPPLTDWFGLIYFETFILAVGGAFFIVAMARERAELRLATAAQIDVLTSVSSRRAFMERAGDTLAKCQATEAPWSLIAFDLDGFKSINDTHGHATGDLVLRKFGEVSHSLLRAHDLIGRIGGEEFAAALPGSSPSAAYAIAERIRVAFADACRTVEGRAVNATVSAGIATAHPGSTFDSILRAADLELYRAKMSGRNRIERSERRSADGDRSTVIRVA
jgi:diguanylate cyclase (GGDEF)-like protein